MRRTKFSPGDRVIIDRVAEVRAYGPMAPKFARALYRCVGTVLPDGDLEWVGIATGKSRGAHGAGVTDEFLMLASEVLPAEGYAEDPESLAKRLSDSEWHKYADLTPKPVRSNPRKPEGGSSPLDKGDLVETVGDDHFPEGVRATVTSEHARALAGMVRVDWHEGWEQPWGWWRADRFRKVENA